MNLSFFALLFVVVASTAAVGGERKSRFQYCNAAGKNALGGPPHVHFVDQSSASSSADNFLFRGGSPDIQTVFDYHALRDAIDNAAKYDNVSLPAQYVVNVINVMNFDQGGYDCQESISEFTYFQTNPQDGAFIFWYTDGTRMNASDPAISSSLRKYLANTAEQWMPDHLMQRSVALHQMLNTPQTTPIVYYLHCDCGCDRTGEVIGSYYLTQLGYDWQKVIDLNTKIANRPMMCDQYLALQWFCLYLNARGAKNNCLVFNPCTP